MPTMHYALVQDIKMLREVIAKRDRAVQDLTGLLSRYMQHVIETKGTSFLDRHGLMPTDSKALSAFDMSIMLEIEKKVKPICVMPSRAAGRSTESTGDNSKPNSPMPLPGVDNPQR